MTTTRTTRRRRRGHGGYLLLEVLLSLTLVAAGVTVGARAISTAIAALGVASDRTRAVIVLENVMSEIEAGILPLPRSADFTFEGQQTDCRWEVRSLPRERSEETGDAYVTVEVTVSWVDRNREREVRAWLGVVR